MPTYIFSEEQKEILVAALRAELNNYSLGDGKDRYFYNATHDLLDYIQDPPWIKGV